MKKDKEYAYKDLYNFEVLDHLDEGDTVYVLDKHKCEAYCVNTMSVCSLMAVLANSRKEDKRYLFWALIEIEEEDDE